MTRRIKVSFYCLNNTTEVLITYEATIVLGWETFIEIMAEKVLGLKQGSLSFLGAYNCKDCQKIVLVHRTKLQSFKKRKYFNNIGEGI